jgi:hypothetical protein
MAIDFGRAARGIATGYISEVLADRRKADEERYDRIKLAENQYYNVDYPAFKAEEKIRDGNVAFIKAELGPIVANYLDAQNITLDNANTRSIVKQFKESGFTDLEKLEINSNILGRKKERRLELDDKLNAVINREQNKPGGISANIAKMFFSKPEEDIAKVGVNQGTGMDAQTQDETAQVQQPDTFTPLSELLGTTGNKFDFNNMNHRAAAGDVESRFSRFFQDPENFDVYDFSSRPDLTADYQSYKDAGYKGSEIEFAFQKFMEENLATPEFGGLEYTGGYRAFDEKVAAKKESEKDKAVVGDNKKFPDASSQIDKDFPDIQIKDDKDAKVDKIPGVLITDETRAIMKEAREARSAIMNDPNLSEEEKERRMDILRESVKKDIKAAGSNPDAFNI